MAEGDGVPLAVDQRYDFHEFGCHLGNVGLNVFQPISDVSDNAPKSAATPKYTAVTPLVFPRVRWAVSTRGRIFPAGKQHRSALSSRHNGKNSNQ